jgi:hypothetical protein
MKYTFLTFILLCTISSIVLAQSTGQDSLSAESETIDFGITSIRIDGEVENPGVVDLSQLPLRTVRIKELAVDDTGRQQFKGAFLYTGYSLFDILGTVKVKKANEKEFSPSTDLYVIVENEKGQRTVLSWGEIFYARDDSRIMLSRGIKAINPSKFKARWPVPAGPRLICADDLNNIRFVSDPTRLTVKSFTGSFSAEKPKEMYSTEMKIVNGAQSFDVGEIPSTVLLRTYVSVGYGHGMGYKGVQSVAGYLLKDALNSLRLDLTDYRESIAVVSAKDRYRAVFSISEIFNRNDNEDFLLVDQRKSKKDGRYSLFASPDFFVDRNVKAIDKIEIVRIE